MTASLLTTTRPAEEEDIAERDPEEADTGRT
jgi:hypothetical protein